MLDMRMFRENAEVLRADHDKRKMPQDNIDEVIRLDNAWKQASYDSDQLRKSRNEAARGIAAAKKSGDSEAVKKIMEEVSSIGSKIEELSKVSEDFLKQRDTIRMRVPNLLHESVPVGEDDQKNTLHSLHGQKKDLDFEPKNHNDIIETNGWVDLARAAKITGSRFYFLQGDLARLEMALQSYTTNYFRWYLKILNILFYYHNFRTFFCEIVEPTFKLTNFSTGTATPLGKNYKRSCISSLTQHKINRTLMNFDIRSINKNCIEHLFGQPPPESTAGPIILSRNRASNFTN